MTKPFNILLFFMIIVTILIPLLGISIFIAFPKYWIGSMLLIGASFTNIGVIIRLVTKREVINNTIIKNKINWLIWGFILIIISIMLSPIIILGIMYLIFEPRIIH
jgi:hypothetical protein